MYNYTLIIPDVHEKLGLAKRILATFPDATEYIWLGDFWDSFEFDKDPDHWRKVAEWMLSLPRDPRNKLLAGNHDVQYYCTLGAYTCSGFKESKHNMIRDVMGVDWLSKNMNFLYPVTIKDQTTVFSHAGVHPRHLAWDTQVNHNYFRSLNDAIKDKFRNGIGTSMLTAGKARGGVGIGGVTWLDWDKEFKPIDGIRQVVGHTPQFMPQEYEGNWCMDTHLDHVGFMDNETGEITYKTLRDVLI